MSRRKTKKLVAKRSTTNNNPLAAIKKMEMDFLKAPALLVAQLNKEIELLKQKDSKVKKALHKIKDQIQTSEKRVKVAKQSSDTAKGKKQLKIAKKAASETTANHNSLLKQAREIDKSLEASLETQARVTAMRKHLSQFQKDWVKEAKQDKAQTKTQGKTKNPPNKRLKETKPAKINKVSSGTELPDFNPNIEPSPTILDNVTFDETSEATS